MKHTFETLEKIRLQHASETNATCATSPDLLLQHPYETIATYI
jgi:hypothetical protein